MAYKLINSKQAAISRKEWIRRRRGEQPTAVVQSRGTSGSSSSGTPLVDEAWRELFSLDNIGTDENPLFAICAKYGIFSNHFISAGGVSTASGGSGGGASSLAELTDVVLGTLADGEVLMYSSGSWRNKPLDLTSYAKLTDLASYATKASLADYVTITDLASQGYISGIDSEMVVNALGYTPLKEHQSLAGYATEEWVMGKGYATTSDLDGRINALVNGAPAAYDTLKEIADVLATNVNSIGDIMTALGNKADKATTLAGYGITDAYTKSEVDTKLGGYLPLSGGTMTNGLTINDDTYGGGRQLVLNSTRADQTSWNSIISFTKQGAEYGLISLDSGATNTLKLVVQQADKTYNILSLTSQGLTLSSGKFIGDLTGSASKLGGQLPAYYATAQSVTDLSNRLSEMFELDANGYIHAKKGLYSDSFISAGGVSTSESIIADLQARVAVLEQQIALLTA